MPAGLDCMSLTCPPTETVKAVLTRGELGVAMHTDEDEEEEDEDNRAVG